MGRLRHRCAARRNLPGRCRGDHPRRRRRQLESTSAGNFVPAAFPEVISVSALADFDGERGGLAGCGLVPDLFAQECDDSFAFFSNNGASVDVIAPGVQVYSAWANGTWRTSSGTSMAAPHIAGIAALMAAAAPGLSPADARTALLASGECPNGAVADADGVAGCGGQGTWRDDTDGIPEPMGHALRAAQRVTALPPPDPEPPSAPTLSASATETSIDLSWTVPADNGGATITSYEVYRGPTSGSATLYDTVTGATSYSDLSVASGETWWYQVAAVNSAGVGTRSNEVSATVSEPPPPANPPSAPTLSAAAGNGKVTLTWTAPSDDGGADVTNYEVYRSTVQGEEVLVTTVGDVSTFQDTGLTNGTTYWYQVAAVNSAGVGVRSNEASSKPSAPATRPSAPRSLKGTKVAGGIQLYLACPELERRFRDPVVPGLSDRRTRDGHLQRPGLTAQPAGHEPRPQDVVRLRGERSERGRRESGLEHCAAEVPVTCKRKLTCPHFVGRRPSCLPFSPS